MSYPVYYVVENDVLPIFFDTFAGSTGASVTMSGLAVTDVEIYKDGSVTQRASDAGYTLLDTDGIDFDGLTGIHGFSIDLSDNTDAGFYSVGPWYHVVVSAVTVDSQTVSFVAAAFRIVSATRGLAGTALPNAAADAAGGLPISDAGGLDLDAKVGALTFGTANRVNAQVYGMEANTLTATAINADAFTAAKFAADVTTELQSGLATAAELAKVPKSDGTATWNATALASIQSEANDALVAYDPPTKAELDAAVANVSVDEIQATALADLFNTDSGTTYASAVAGSVVKEIADNAGGSALTTDAIAEAMFTYDATATYGTANAGSVVKQIADNAGGSALTEAGIADAVLDELLSGHTGAGSLGKAVADILDDTGTSGVVVASLAANSVTAAALAADAGTEIGTAVWATAARTLTAATNITDTGGTLNVDASGNVFLADGAHGGTAATLTFSRLVGASATSNEPCVKLTGNGTGAGLRVMGGDGGANAAELVASTSSGLRGLYVSGHSSYGAEFSSTQNDGVLMSGTNTGQAGLVVTGQTEDLILTNSAAPTLRIAVWTGGTRVLTAATNITSTGGTTVPQTGDSFARIGATGSGLTSLASQTSVDDLPTNAELATAITTGLTTALTEGYRGAGATGSVRDLLYEILANIVEFTISGTTKTAKKLDGSTTAKTYTLNDATTPTGITETT